MLPWHACGGQRMTLWSWFPPSVFTWVLGFELKSPDLLGKHPYLLSHLSSPESPFLFTSLTLSSILPSRQPFYAFFTRCLSDPPQVLYLMRGHSAEQNGRDLCSYVKDLNLACFFPDWCHPHCCLQNGKPTSCSRIISQPHITTKTYAERIGLLSF